MPRLVCSARAGVERVEPLAEPHKTEGVSLAGGSDLPLVADGDDRGTPSPHLSASLAL